MKYLTPFFLLAALVAALLAVWFPENLWQLIVTSIILFIAAASVAAAMQRRVDK